ncbi:alpha-glucosidase/alpha-galactosidase, partial [Paenibacillus sp. TAF58]
MVKIVLLGAGSVEFTNQLSADLFRFDDLPLLQFVLYDINPQRLEFARVTAEQVAARAGRKADIVATLDRREALDGADFVINVIAVGGLAATRKDLEIPAAMGLRQTVGDTTGVGGVFRGLRTFPVLSK